ncbi:hypothetical protein [Elizabethkingia meningoseptica]|uniref:hypothetical protein n=1 Tax=Elizabethkingia meningoseptica TaxID=238 RepID=UPI00301648D1
MMKLFFLSVFPLFMFFDTDKETPNLELVRGYYDKAVADKTLCDNMIKDLQQVSDETIFLAYLGGFQTIWAKHASNPISKLKIFNRGKKNIESAIKMQPDNIEIRFIRLSVQKNAPSFLGYNKNIKEDQLFIENNRREIRSPVLLKNIDKLLKHSK